ncbi:glutamyl-tRNA synthetase, putative [Coccomyxa subellipsoidea C-169]|uniref:glutamate--tRNA ligase n=1 Tax=Coccomyxa subellipsoidea (strain C-169) TaxID=574566 RepID=I0YW46_COCSC|nr:glutamyl-tRNA synthetase, putative [Coccomyxa subellipsoidea C-169]EIE22615.1 glutamyl-tRNA synthetase, putative [Coccomyxa subellipsoidea C-169]|eukprot:XP_005647159.1 glutamyl-tRNA synthetase, putative [Coccomyxa subellipsoidea C-169]
MGAAERPLLSYFEKAPPLAAIAVATLAGVHVEIKADPKFTKDSLPALSIPGGEQLVGLTPILRYFSRLQDPLYGGSAFTSVQVDQWLEFAPHLVTGGGLEPACATLNEALALRTYLVGYSLSPADVAVWGQLQVTLQWDKLRRSGSLPHLGRWFELVSTEALLKEVADKYGPKKPSSRTEFRKELAAAGMGGGDTGSFKIDLRNVVKGAVKTRFPPEPSGYMHIGHAKAALLNYHIATLHGGHMAIRFDDTNPSKENTEYVDAIIADVERLGLKFKGPITYTSDYFPQMLDLAERLIKAGILYADDTPVEQMRAERMEGIESQRRNRSVDETLAVWKEMVQGTPEGRKNCIRFKIDMKENNAALRDPVAFRCNDTPHWRTGTKYKARTCLPLLQLVYPTYDCACPFVDSLEGVTHALRTSEYKDREAQFYWVLKAQQKVWPGLPDVQIWDYSRLSLVNTVLSKRKLTWFVEAGKVDGWDDPRMPTVQGVFRRGLQLEALKEFILSQGASKNEWDKLWSTNKRIIDPVCPRHVAVKSDGRVKLRLNNGPAEPEVVSVPKHKKNADVGTKATTRTKEVWLEQEDAQAISEGEEVTLMDWGNAIVQRVSKDESGAATGLEGVLHLEGSVKTTKLKLTWLPDISTLTPLRLVELDHLITKKKPEEEDKIEDLVNPNSRTECLAWGDANMGELRKGEVLQLERKGYYIVDVPAAQGGQPAVLFAIPDGHQKKVAQPAPAATAATVAAPAGKARQPKGISKAVSFPRLTTAACYQSSTRRTASSRTSPPPCRMPATLWQTAYLRRATPPAQHRSPPQTAPRALFSENSGCGPTTAVF